MNFDDSDFAGLFDRGRSVLVDPDVAERLPLFVESSRRSTAPVPSLHPAIFSFRSMLLKKIFTRIAGIAMVFATLTAYAMDDAPVWSFHGFGNFSASGTDTDRIGFRRDISQANGVTRSWGIYPDSRLGLQLDVDFNDSLHAGIQWVARNHVGDFFEQNLDWTYLRWRPAADLDVRIGRLGLDLFMLSDYRNVGYAYLWVRPPHEYYGNLSLYHFDGADISRKFTLGSGYLTLKGFGGHSYLQSPTPGDQVVDQRFVVAGASVVYEIDEWRFRLGYGYSQSLTEFLPRSLTDTLDSQTLNAVWPGARSLIGAFSVKGKETHFASAGLSYDDGVWVGQIEGAYENTDLEIYPSFASGYLSLGRRFGPVTPFVLLGISKTLNDSVQIPNLRVQVPALISLRNAVDGALNRNGINEKSVSLGLRWDVYENIAFKGQWSHFWLGQNGTQLWVEPLDAGPTPNEVNVFSISVDFIF